MPSRLGSRYLRGLATEASTSVHVSGPASGVGAQLPPAAIKPATAMGRKRATRCSLLAIGPRIAPRPSPSREASPCRWRPRHIGNGTRYAALPCHVEREASPVLTPRQSPACGRRQARYRPAARVVPSPGCPAWCHTPHRPAPSDAHTRAAPRTPSPSILTAPLTARPLLNTSLA
jgi:hypothetical protein